MPKDTFLNLPESKREGFIAVALDEFATHDYESASLSRIVARAGIAKGSVYQYFENKQELYTYLLQLALEKKREYMSEQPPPDESQGVFATLHWLFKHGSEFELRHPDFARLGYRALYGKSPLPSPVLEQARQGTRDYFEGLARMGQARGELDPALDPAVAAFVFTAIFEQLGRYLVESGAVDSEALRRGGGFPSDAPGVQAIFDQLLRLLHHGMGRREGESL